MEDVAPWIWRAARVSGIGRLVSKNKHSLEASFEDAVIGEYLDLDLETKLCALKVSSSVVSLVSETEEKEIVFACSGTIIGCDWQEKKGSYAIFVLTSASLLRRHGYEDGVPTSAHEPNLKVHVYLLDGMSYEAGDYRYNFYYNIAVVKFESRTPFPPARLKSIDHSLPAIPKGQQHIDSKSVELCPHCTTSVDDSNLFTLCLGDKVIALGRHHPSRNLMAAPGEFSSACCGFDCGELLRNGIGGPLINYNGEVIGINFVHKLYTAFLPINIAYKCVEHLNYRRELRPWVGIKVVGLNVIIPEQLEKILLQYPEIIKGVIVEEVVPESPAKAYGICKDDVIIACGGKSVGSSSEFYGILLDKTGESVEVTLARPNVGRYLPIGIPVTDASSHRDNRWRVYVQKKITGFGRRV